MAILAAGFVVGVACEGLLNWHGVHYALASGLLSACWLAFRVWGRLLRARLAILLILAFLLGAWRIGLDRHAFDEHHIVDQLADRDGRMLVVRGRVETRPQLLSRTLADFDFIGRDPASTFLVSVEAVRPMQGDWQPSSGLLRVHCAGPALHVSPGGMFERTGVLHPVRPGSNPGRGDPRQASIDRRLLATLYLPTERDETPTAPPPPAFAIRDRIRLRAQGLLLGRADPLTSEDQVLLDNLILGRRGHDEELISGPFLRTGTYHYLAISGLHLAILAGVSFSLLRVLRVRPRRAALIVLLLIVGYCLMAEPRPPIFRAGLMVCLACVGMLLYREPGSVNLLGAAAFVLLMICPADLFNAGFQLSFVVVLGLLLFAGPFYRALYRRIAGCEPGIDAPLPPWLADHPIAEWLLRAGLQIFSVATIAWVAGLPLTAYYFHRFYPLSVLSSIAMWGPVWLVLVLGYVKMAISVLWPGIGAWMNGPLHSASALMLAVVNWLDAMPFMSVTVGQPDTLSIVAFYAYLALWHVQPRWLSKRWLIVIGLAGTLLIVVLPSATGPDDGQLEMTALDVGNGLCQVVRTPAGQKLLFDCGTHSSDDLAERTVIPFLASRRPWHESMNLAATFISHSHLDHYSGMPGLARRGILGEIFVPPAMTNLQPPDEHDRSLAAVVHMTQMLNRQGCRFRVAAAGDRFRFDQATVDVLWPPAWLDQIEQRLANESSHVVRISFAGRRIMLTADAGDLAINRLLAGGEAGEVDLRADVLMLPHHGAVNAYTDRFIRAVDPAIVIVSSRRPAEAILARSTELRSGARTLLTTSQSGAISVRIDAAGKLSWRGHVPTRQ